MSTFRMLTMSSEPSFIVKRSGHTHHVHIGESGGQEQRRTLASCDFLREHGDTATEYVALKKKLAALTDEQTPHPASLGKQEK
jgi:GrpB-like predicted nucleotidyltransferase (UPF0157 family)